MSRHAFSILEILIGLGVLAAVSIPLFQMFGGQRHELAWSGREAKLQVLATSILQMEEARLVRASYQGAEGRTTRTEQAGDPGDPLAVEEVISIAPAAPLVPSEGVTAVPGLYRIDVVLTWKDGRAGGQTRSLQRTKLVVNREESPLSPVRPGGPTP